MKYGYTIERQDGTTAHGTLYAVNTAAAHSAMLETAGGEKYRVYPLHRALLALSIATATAKNAVMRQGTPTQVTIDRELRMLSGMTAAAMLARPEMTGRELTEYIMHRLPLFGHDMQDFFGYAMQGVQAATAAGYDVRTAAAAGYKALNHYIHSLNTATARELSTEYIMDGGGDIVALSTVISCIIRGGEKWTATAGGGLTAEQAADLGAAIAAAAAVLRPAQRDIVRMLARGLSVKQIADNTGRGETTVKKNIAIIRGIMCEYMKQHCPWWTEYIMETSVKADLTAQAAAAWSANCRTAAGLDAKKASDKATQAARAAAYRARKRAEKAAALCAAIVTTKQ